MTGVITLTLGQTPPVRLAARLTRAIRDLRLRRGRHRAHAGMRRPEPDTIHFSDRKEIRMPDIRFPKPTRADAERRRALAPEPEQAFRTFSKAVFAEGALDARTKQLIAVAVAHVTQCPWCIEGHVKAARREGASAEQIMEAIWVAAEMRAGAAFAHSVKALAQMDEKRAN